MWDQRHDGKNILQDENILWYEHTMLKKSKSESWYVTIKHKKVMKHNDVDKHKKVIKYKSEPNIKAN